LSASRNHFLRCIGCGAEYEELPSSYTCPSCGDLLEAILRKRPEPDILASLRGASLGVWSFRDMLPVGPEHEPVSLDEGGTPLLELKRLAAPLGPDKVYVKYEGQNPTGSFKDRGMTVAVTLAKGRGAKALICASTGNTAASLSAYAARAGSRAVVLIPRGLVARGKLVQAMAYGATVLEVDGNFDRALELVVKLAAKRRDLQLLNSINPYRLEGQKTLAYELVVQLGGRVPDYVVLPVGNGGNISAIWKGFKEIRGWGLIDRLPRLVAVQAEGAAPIATAFNSGWDEVRPLERPSTVATAINIGRPVLWKKALRALRESSGIAVTVTDEEIMRARERLASKEGILVEAASAAPLAALGKLKGIMGPDATVVCVATGSGLKDRELLERRLENPTVVRGEEELTGILSAL
jgi:threonine synthase